VRCTYKVRRNDEGEAQRRRWTFYEAIIISKGESQQVNELQFPFSGERISLKILKNQKENKGGIVPFLESPKGKAVLVSL
jgi:hypothetical protein